MKPDIYIISLGCPRNLVDSEILIGKLKKKGFRVFYRPRKNAVAVVNTCGFIEEAKSESIGIILELAALKSEGRIARIVVTGCLSQRYAEDLMEEIKEIDGIFGSSTFPEIPDYIDRIVEGKSVIRVEKKPNFLYDHRMPREMLTPDYTAYVKIQEGCVNSCSYCVIPQIRGPFRSRSMQSLLEETAALRQRGVKEVNLIGQDTTLYGVDRYKKPKLPELLKKISRIMEGGWVRLLYTHPAHYTAELIKVIKDETPVCKYVDLPIQHASDRILKKMNRHVTKKDIKSLIEKIKKEIPKLVIRTSVIVGFPGEDEKDFLELEELIRETKFGRLGAFMYSREEGTKAYDFDGQVPENVKRTRLEHIMELQRRISEENNRSYFGRTIRVLIEEKDPSSVAEKKRIGATAGKKEHRYLGRSQHDAPEVDGMVYVRSEKQLKPGDFANVKIEDVLEYDLVGST